MPFKAGRRAALNPLETSVPIEAHSPRLPAASVFWSHGSNKPYFYLSKLLMAPPHRARKLNIRNELAVISSRAGGPSPNGTPLAWLRGHRWL